MPLTCSSWGALLCIPPPYLCPFKSTAFKTESNDTKIVFRFLSKEVTFTQFLQDHVVSDFWSRRLHILLHFPVHRSSVDLHNVECRHVPEKGWGGGHNTWGRMTSLPDFEVSTIGFPMWLPRPGCVKGASSMFYTLLLSLSLHLLSFWKNTVAKTYSIHIELNDTFITFQYINRKAFTDCSLYSNLARFEVLVNSMYVYTLLKKLISVVCPLPYHTSIPVPLWICKNWNQLKSCQGCIVIAVKTKPPSRSVKDHVVLDFRRRISHFDTSKFGFTLNLLVVWISHVM